MSVILSAFRRDPNKSVIAPVPDAGLTDARARNSLAADNLRETLTALLDESDRLQLRPMYLAGPRERK